MTTKLGDWLRDIEITAHLTSEGQAKLAKAKSRGLAHTLVTEVINSDKSWEEIRIYYSSNFAILTSILIPHVSWTSNNRKRNLLWPTSIDSRPKPKDAASQTMLPPLKSLSND